MSEPTLEEKLADLKVLHAFYLDRHPRPRIFDVQAIRRDIDDAERLRVQLAGCLTAAEGGIYPQVLAKQGDYGWSAAYAAVVNLRRKYEDFLKKGVEVEDE